MAANEFIVVLGYSMIGKSVILLVNVNFLRLQVVFTTGRWLFIVRNTLPSPKQIRSGADPGF